MPLKVLSVTNKTSVLYLAAAIHGDILQAEREKIMFAFKHGNLPILVATDVAGVLLLLLLL